MAKKRVMFTVLDDNLFEQINFTPDVVQALYEYLELSRHTPEHMQRLSDYTIDFGGQEGIEKDE